MPLRPPPVAPAMIADRDDTAVACTHRRPRPVTHATVQRHAPHPARTLPTRRPVTGAPLSVPPSPAKSRPAAPTRPSAPATCATKSWPSPRIGTWRRSYVARSGTLPPHAAPPGAPSGVPHARPVQRNLMLGGNDSLILPPQNLMGEPCAVKRGYGWGSHPAARVSAESVVRSGQHAANTTTLPIRSASQGDMRAPNA